MSSGKVKMMGTLVLAVILVAAGLTFFGGDDDQYEKEEEPDPLEEYRSLLDFNGENYPASVSLENTCETTIAVNPNDPDNIVIGANDYTTPTGDSWCGAYWSRDGGKTWGQTLVPGYRGGPVSVLTGYGIAGDPVLVFDPDGNCYMAGLAARRKLASPARPFQKESDIFVAKSTDGGETWDQVSIVVRARTKAVFHDKEWLTVDPNDGTLYVTWTAFNGIMYGSSEIVCATSTNGGMTWGDYVVISEITSGETQVQGSYPVVDEDGTLHVVWIEYNGLQVRYSRSTDKGQSFSAPQNIGPVVELPRVIEPHTYRTPTMPSLDVDRSDTNTSGNLYVTWPDFSTGDADILMVKSTDGGSTWTEPLRVNNDNVSNGAHQFFPSVSVSPQGYVGIVFYDMRDDPDRLLIHTYFAFSTDGGESFPYQFNITNQMFDGEASGGSFLGQITSSEHTGFIGDYIQVVSDENAFYFCWCDTRNGSPSDSNSDAYFARVAIVAVDGETAGGE